MILLYFMMTGTYLKWFFETQCEEKIPK